MVDLYKTGYNRRITTTSLNMYESLTSKHIDVIIFKFVINICVIKRDMTCHYQYFTRLLKQVLMFSNIYGEQNRNQNVLATTKYAFLKCVDPKGERKKLLVSCQKAKV